MDETLNIVIGLLGGLALLAVIVGGSIFWETRRKPGKHGWLAPPSGNIDTGPSIGSDGGHN